MQKCLWCSATGRYWSTGQSQDRCGDTVSCESHCNLVVICIRHTWDLLVPNMSWANTSKGPQRPKHFLMQETIYMLNYLSHYTSSWLQFCRIKVTTLLWSWFFYRNTCHIIEIQTFSIYWVTEGKNCKLIIDLHRKFQCSVPQKINSHLFGCLNMDLRA